MWELDNKQQVPELFSSGIFTHYNEKGQIGKPHIRWQQFLHKVRKEKIRGSKN
jgi:hypothetical protein